MSESKKIESVLYKIGKQLNIELSYDKDVEELSRRSLARIAENYMSWELPKHRICSLYNFRQLYGMLKYPWVFQDIKLGREKYRELCVIRPLSLLQEHILPECSSEWEHLVFTLKHDLISNNGHHFTQGEKLVCTGRDQSGNVKLERIRATLRLHESQTDLFEYYTDDLRDLFGD